MTCEQALTKIMTTDDEENESRLVKGIDKEETVSD
jgi:hypothetical protein